jgi:transposase, IS5 family
MKAKKARGFFDESDRLAKLSEQGDPLLRLSRVIDWEGFRPLLDSMLKVEARGKGGRPPFDYVMMFKVLVLQRYYNLSDDQTEYQILDRMSFMRFLGLELSDKVPDSKTVWHFRERLSNVGGVERLFAHFGAELEAAGLLAHKGSIVDASFVEAPRQRNTREENAEIKAGKTPQGWPSTPNKLRQKDLDARWVKKGGVNYYGYKNHVKTDQVSKLVTGYTVTPASTHDSQAMEGLLDESDKDQPLNADSAYAGAPLEKVYQQIGVVARINEKGTRGHPLTDIQKAANREKSRIRARVEHVFGFIENSMGGSTSRLIGMRRTTALVGMMNLVYNMFRMIHLMAKHARTGIA